MRLFFRLLLLAAIHLSLGELADKNAGNASGFCEVQAVTGSRLIQEYFTRAPRSEKKNQHIDLHSPQGETGGIWNTKRHDEVFYMCGLVCGGAAEVIRGRCLGWGRSSGREALCLFKQPDVAQQSLYMRACRCERKAVCVFCNRKTAGAGAAPHMQTPSNPLIHLPDSHYCFSLPLYHPRANGGHSAERTLPQVQP